VRQAGSPEYNPTHHYREQGDGTSPERSRDVFGGGSLSGDPFDDEECPVIRAPHDERPIGTVP